MLAVMFIVLNSAKKNFKNFALNFTAVETPTWTLLLASSMK